MASADPRDHPELTFVGPTSGMHLPPGCPPPDPGQIVESGVTISPGEDGQATVPPPDGGLVVIAHDDLPEPVFVEPQGS
jgi:hypothetical protein